MHRIELQPPALQCPLASSTPVYGHDYAIAHEGQKEQLRPLDEASSSSPDSSWDEPVKGLDDPRKAEGSATCKSGESSDDPFIQEQPFDGDFPLFPETVVRRKSRSAPQDAEKRSSPVSETAACGAKEERAKRESVGSKHFHY